MNFIKMFVALIAGLVFWVPVVGQVQVGQTIFGDAAGDNAGVNVSLSNDGRRIAVNAPQNDLGGMNAGSVKIYQNVSGNWVQLGSTLVGDSSNDRLGGVFANPYNRVVLSGNGSTVAVASIEANGSTGYIKVYDWVGTDWTQVHNNIVPANYSFIGLDLAISDDGNRIAAIGVDGSALSVFTLERGANSWIIDPLPFSFVLDDSILDLSADGQNLIVGTAGGEIASFTFSSGMWSQQGTVAGNYVRNGVLDLSGDGNFLLAAMSNTDTEVTILERVGLTWVARQELSILNSSASISYDGTVVAGRESGDLVIYQKQGNSWDLKSIVSNAGPWASSLSDDGLIVGSGNVNDDNGTFFSHGAVRIYDLTQVLPVELLYLSVATSTKTTHLSWQTASETANRGFLLQHSPNGQTWSTLDFIPGAGDSQTVQNYTYTHENPTLGTNYYRLEQEDFDGTRTLSEVVTAEFGGVGELNITPNPATELITVNSSLLAEQAGYTLTVFDATGRQVLQQRNALQLRVAELPAGVYTLLLKAGSTVQTERFVRR